MYNNYAKKNRLCLIIYFSYINVLCDFMIICTYIVKILQIQIQQYKLCSNHIFICI